MIRSFWVVLWVWQAFGQSPISVSSPFIGPGPVAPGSILVVNFGGPPSDLLPSDYSVRVAGIPATILALDAAGLRFAVPSATPLGTASVAVTYRGSVLGPAQIRVVHAAPALLGAAQNVSGGTVSLNRMTNPAQTGDFIVLWATGLGDLTEADVTVDLAGEMITPAFAGHAPGEEGVDQINFQVPADAQRGCYVPVSIQSADVISQWNVVAISDAPGSCSHPLGLSEEQMTGLDQGKTINVGSINVTSGGSLFIVDPNVAAEYVQQDEGSGTFGSAVASYVVGISGVQVPDSCDLDLKLVTPFNTLGGVTSLLPPHPLPGSLAFAGPAGQQLNAVAFANGTNGSTYIFYSGAPTSAPPVKSPDQLPGPFFVPGTWSASAMGSTIVSPFQTGLLLPPPVHWTNRAATVSRSLDLTVTWDPTGYAASDVMTVTLSSLPSASIGMHCTVPAQSGSVVLPQTLLQRVSPATYGQLSLSVSPRVGEQSGLQLGFADGSSGPGWVSYAFSETVQVAIQ